MSYMYYTVYRNGQKIQAGYGVETTCEKPDCKTKIDRGLDYLCGATPGGDEWGCGGYFCHEHLFLFGGDGAPQVCRQCADAAKKEFAAMAKEMEKQEAAA